MATRIQKKKKMSSCLQDNHFFDIYKIMYDIKFPIKKSRSEEN